MITSRPTSAGDARADRVRLASLVARVLRDPAGAPPASHDVDVEALIAVATQHRVLLQLGWTLRAAATLGDWPPDFIDAFHRAERRAVVVDGLRHAELVAVLGELNAAGVRVVVFKGAALAHTHYPASHLRVRQDTDLLVAAAEVRALEDVLRRLGYVRPPETSGRLVSYQSHYHRIDRYGVTHAFDVHWKISNLQMVADCLTFQELWNCRVPVAALGAFAVTVDDVHALLLALVHRAGHHPGSRDLLWIYDLHLLATRLTSAEMSQAREISRARGLSHIAADGLALARSWFGTAAPDPPFDPPTAGESRQQTSIVMHGRWTQARVLRLDLQALPGWRARGRLIREHVLPPASYVQARYGVRSKLLLPGLYVWRALRGAPKWLRRLSADE
jgi:hypothetical protein